MLKTTSPVAATGSAGGLAVEARAVLEQQVGAHLISPWMVLNSGAARLAEQLEQGGLDAGEHRARAAPSCRSPSSRFSSVREVTASRATCTSTPAVEQVVRRSATRTRGSRSRTAAPGRGRRGRSRPPRAAENTVFSTGSDAVQVLGHLGHGRAQPLRVLLGDDHRQRQRPGALDEHPGVVRHPLEVEHRRAEALLHVDDHQRGALAVEHPRRLERHPDRPDREASARGTPRRPRRRSSARGR